MRVLEGKGKHSAKHRAWPCRVVEVGESAGVACVPGWMQVETPLGVESQVVGARDCTCSFHCRAWAIWPPAFAQWDPHSGPHRPARAHWWLSLARCWPLVQ